jgi:hypothetical protein
VRRYYLANKEYFNKIKNTYKSKLKLRELILVMGYKEGKGYIVIVKAIAKIAGPLLD